MGSLFGKLKNQGEADVHDWDQDSQKGSKCEHWENRGGGKLQLMVLSKSDQCDWVSRSLYKVPPAPRPLSKPMSIKLKHVDLNKRSPDLWAGSKRLSFEFIPETFPRCSSEPSTVLGLRDAMGKKKTGLPLRNSSLGKWRHSFSSEQ